MPKLSLIKDFFGLITSINAAWPTLLVLGGLALSTFLALPPAMLIGIGTVAVLAVVLLVYQLRRRLFYVSLQDASRRAYEQLDGTMWAVAAARMHDAPNPEDTLDYMGQLLIMDIALYGVRPPSTMFKRIEDKLLKRSVIKDNCDKLVSNDPKDLPWTDLAVERTALKRRIKEMKESNLPPPREEDSSVVTIALPRAFMEKHFPEKIEDAQRQRDKATEILRRMVEASDGSLMVHEYLEGKKYQVGDTDINEAFDARELAVLHETVEKLEQQGLIRLVNRTNTLSLYQATAAGYRKVELPR